MMMGKRTLLGAIALSSIAAVAVAQQSLVDERQDGFNEMGAAMKTLRDQLKGGKPDTAKVAAAADELTLLAEKIPGWFPEGSGPASGVKTDARDYIWENKAKFDGITQALIDESKAMAELARAGDTAGMQKKLLVIRDNCSSCHDSFRVD